MDESDPPATDHRQIGRRPNNSSKWQWPRWKAYDQSIVSLDPLSISEIKVHSEEKPGTSIAKLQEEDGSHVLYKGTKAFHNISKSLHPLISREKLQLQFLNFCIAMRISPHCQNGPAPPSVAVALDSGFDAPQVIANRWWDLQFTWLQSTHKTKVALAVLQILRYLYTYLK